jgi:TorA maturation chaperone TorD
LKLGKHKKKEIGASLTPFVPKEYRTVMSEHAEKFLSQAQEVPPTGRESAGVNKTALLAQQEAEARGNMYGFLATVYLRPPEQDLVRQVVAEDFLEELSSLFGGEAVAALKNFAATAHIDKAIPSLKQEYMDLFAVPTGRYVTPFEDVYRGKPVEGKQERGPLLGERAIAVRRIYREAGAEMDRECKELPTHIGVELSFMSFLCEREAAAIRNEGREALRDQEKRKAMDSSRYRELQVRFLQEHLNDWFPQLSQAIQANAKSLFYKGLALITAEFLARDTASLSAQSDSDEHTRA